MCDDPNCTHSGLRRAWDSIGRFFGGWGYADNKKEVKAEIVEFGPLEKISEEEFSKTDVTLDLVFNLILGGGADPYTAIGNAGVGPYAEEREMAGMLLLPLVNPEVGLENASKKIVEKVATKEAKTLFHYTNEAGYKAIMETGELLPSIGAKNARYGAGQYFTDIAPGTATVGQTSARLYGVPWNKSKLTHYIEVEVSNLNIIQNKPYNFLNPSSSPLNLNGKVVSHGQSIFLPKK